MRKVWRFALTPKQESSSIFDHEADDDPEVVDGTAQPSRQGQLCEVDMPVGAEILPTVFITSSTGGLTLYALVDPDAATETRTFFVCGNGVELPEGAGGATFISTYKRRGTLTAHVFEVVPVPAEA